MSKKKIVTLITILVLSIAVAVPSIVSAAETTSSARPGSITAYFQELIQGLVDSGKLSQTDADATLASLDMKIAELKANRPERSDQVRFYAGGLDLAEVASILGITEDQLKEQLSVDTTLWKIASQNGKLDALKEAIVEKAQSTLAKQVAYGKMTSEEADAALAELKGKVAAITADSEDAAIGFFGGHSGKGGRGHHSDLNGRIRGDRSGADIDETADSIDEAMPIPDV